MADDRQALSGLRILDFTQVLAGPFATQQLAQLGADVVKIEEPQTGDITRGLLSMASDGMAPSFLTCNLGKRSLTLNLKHEHAKDIVFKLAASSDAVVENFKPGTIERLGFGYDAIRAVKPNIVYASISGYGQTGPKAELPAFDGAIQADSGMMSISGHPDTGPMRTGYFSVDMSTALNAAFAITAALFRRHVTGEGQRVDISMLDSAMVMTAPQMSNYLVSGTTPELMGNRSPTRQPTCNVFETQDGYVQIVALRETQIEAFLAIIGEQALRVAYPEPADRVDNAAQINAQIVPKIAAKPTRYWVNALEAAGVPVAAIRQLSEVAGDPQFEHRLSFAEIESPGAQDAKVRVVSAGHLAHPAAPRVQRPPPRLGEHTDEILADLGFTEHDVQMLRSSRCL
jgi:crotonobetainyl-CoA:carnitine CoA-transferase CaiB-like acyl-CoA transferase